MNIGSIVVWVITGALAGFLVGQLFRRKGFGLIGNVIIGLLGALVGGGLMQVLNIRITGLPEFTFSLADLVVAFIGALILMLVVRFLARR